MASSRTTEAAFRPPVEWSASATPEAAAALEAAGLKPRLSRMIARRGVESTGESRVYLEPSVDDLHDPFLLDGMAAAVERLLKAREGEETVAVVGDYDVDGISATALLTAVFGACGLASRAILPHRMRDGYGFQSAQVERAQALGASVIVTADCGSHSHDAVRASRDAGIDVIVTDHHLPGDPLGGGAVHINPHQESCTYPFRELSGAGIAFKLATAFAGRVGRLIAPEILLRVACLGTVADMVPLRGENRTIASLGLESLATTRSAGLRALLEAAGVSGTVKAGDIGFRIGPRINAAGRMDSPDLALELLLTKDPEEARRIAAQLDEWNTLRQQTEATVVEEATAHFEQSEELPPILVAWDPSWHRGVLGIAAGRISRRFHRPAILLSAEGEAATGSGRSVSGLHLHDFLTPWKEKLVRFGGHSQAIGLTAELAVLPELASEWIEAARSWDPSILVRKLRYEETVGAGEIDEELLGDITSLEPFGIGNPRPLFRLGPLTPTSAVRRFGRDHLSLRASDSSGDEIDLVGWRWQERADELEDRFELLGQIAYDRYLKRAVVEIVDVRPAATSA